MEKTTFDYDAIAEKLDYIRRCTPISYKDLAAEIGIATTTLRNLLLKRSVFTHHKTWARVREYIEEKNERLQK